jgi:thioredoxin 1
VKRIRNNEQWYDTLMGTKGLVVVDFGATWCKACQQVKPQFDALSSAPAYKEVTFVSVDADECPVLVGDNRVDAFPTFKFFRNSAEEDLPVVGADIEEVRERLDELLAGAA